MGWVHLRKRGAGVGRTAGWIPNIAPVICEPDCVEISGYVAEGTVATIATQMSAGSVFVQWELWLYPPGWPSVGGGPTSPTNPPQPIADSQLVFTGLTSTQTPVSAPVPAFDVVVIARFALAEPSRILPVENGEFSGTEPCPAAPSGVYSYAETVIVPWFGSQIVGVGWQGMRVGHDSPCGTPFHVYRAAWRFALGALGGPSPSVFFEVHRLITVNPSNPMSGANRLHPGVGTVILEWIDHDSVLLVGGTDTTVFHAAPLWTAAEQLTPSVPEGIIRANVTEAFNQAKAQGFQNLVLRARLLDESDTDSQDGAAWYALSGVASASPFQPRLNFTQPEKQLAATNPGTLRMSVVEPCAVLVNDILETLPDLPDWDKGRGKGGIQTTRRGNVVVVQVLVMDQLPIPARPLDPAAVRLTLTASDDTVVLADTAMARVARGRYQYVYRIPDTDPLGLYRAEFEVLT